MNFDPCDTEALRGFLRDNSDEKYRSFHSGLIPRGREIYGVRSPALKKLARDIAGERAEEFIACCPDDYHEERVLKGLVIAYAKMPTERRLELVREFVPLIDNWAVCDSFCGALKEADKRQEEYFGLISEYTGSGEEYELRFAAVMLLGHFVNEEYIDRVLEIYRGMRHEGYYVKMAVAWGLSECYVKFRDKTLVLLRGRELDRFTQNKVIQKCRESFRVSAEDKEMLKGLKI